MNEQTDFWINEQIKRHYEEALKFYKPNQIVGVFCQGSQNYGLGLKNSDIDTKCILTPTLKDVCFNKKPISTTHILDNNEHLDAKDIRLYINCFEKQNLNFLEILFTPYKIVNPQYAKWWNKLVENREAIAHYDIHRAIKSMKGIALEKYHAMEHRYPSKIDIIDKYSYDSKQLHHLLRVEEYLRRYVNGESYESCLIPTEFQSKILRAIKEDNGLLSLEEARERANTSLLAIERLCDYGLQRYPEGSNEEVEELFKEVQYEIMRFAVTMELVEGE